MKEIMVNSFNDSPLTCYKWDNVKKAKGVIQIIHGMAEHAKRYDDFAKFMNKNGYIVFADDHRAHGKTAGTIDAIGKYNCESNVFFDTMLDEKFISKMLKKEYNLPLILLGHSYGSLILQKYMLYAGDFDGSILSGSAYMNTFENKLAKKIAKLAIIFKGNDAPAKMIENMSFKKFNNSFKDTLWITSNKEESDKYANDPYCGTAFSVKFYYDLMTSALHAYKKSRLQKINRSKPILILSGKLDRFSKNAKLAIRLYKMYTQLDVKSVKLKLYDNMRHEVLNETKKDIVYKDILKFADKICK